MTAKSGAGKINAQRMRGGAQQKHDGKNGVGEMRVIHSGTGRSLTTLCNLPDGELRDLQGKKGAQDVIIIPSVKYK